MLIRQDEEESLIYSPLKMNGSQLSSYHRQKKTEEDEDELIEVLDNRSLRDSFVSRGSRRNRVSIRTRVSSRSKSLRSRAPAVNSKTNKDRAHFIGSHSKQHQFRSNGPKAVSKDMIPNNTVSLTSFGNQICSTQDHEFTGLTGTELPMSGNSTLEAT